MIYNYKCDKCDKIEEISISTYDIMDKYGRVDQNKLTQRMYEQRFCECRGELKKTLSKPQKALWFETRTGKGKISQRFQ